MESVSAARAYELLADVERFKSKVYHVWTFFGQAGSLALKALAVVHRILAEMEKPRTGVFPKQDALGAAVAYGNFIHAPLFGALVPKGRTVFVDPADPSKPHADQWRLLERFERVSEKTLDDIIELNELSVGSAAAGNGRQKARSGDLFPLPPCAQTMLAVGVTQNQRVACFRLAVQLKRAGLPFDSTVAVLTDWATRNRPTGGKRVIEANEITSQAACAYDKDYRACGCEDPAVMPYCEPACRVRGTPPIGRPLERSTR